MSFYKWGDDTLFLRLYVQANAKKDELIGEYGDRLKVRITALPVENKANNYLLKYLAKHFAVPPSQVKLVKGENQRAKQVKIIRPQQLPEIIKRPIKYM